MTIGKKLTAFASVLLLLAVTLVLGSCAKADNSQVLQQLESLRDAQTQEDLGDGYSRYRIVVPESCSGAIWEMAERMATHVSHTTGKPCSTVKDSETVADEAGVREILLGYTHRESSRELLASLCRDDYICASVGAAVVLGGRSESATLKAAERFISENAVTKGGILTVSNGFEYFCEYQYSGAVLWDNRLGSMTVICSPENGALARLFVDFAADRCGDYPELLYGSEGTDGSRELLLTLDSSAVGLSKIVYDGEDVRVISDTEYGLSVAAFGLLERLFNGEDKAEISGDREISYVYEIPRVSVGFMSATIADDGGAAGAVAVTRYINDMSVEVLLIGGVSDTLVAELEMMTDSGKSLHYIKMDNGDNAVAVYNGNRFDVKTMEPETADGCDAVSLVLEDKENGRLYGMLDFFVTNASNGSWADNVSEGLATSAGISFALLRTESVASDFSTPHGTVAEYSAKNDLNGGEGRVLGLVSAEGNALAQVTVEQVDEEMLTVVIADVRAAWCDGFFALASENDPEG